MYSWGQKFTLIHHGVFFYDESESFGVAITTESIFFRNKKIIVNFIDYLNYTYKLKYIHVPTDWSNDWFPQRFAIIPTGHLTVPLIRVCLNWFLFGKDIMGKKNLITFDWNMSQLSSGEMFHRSFWTQNVRVCFLFLFWSLTYSFFHVFNSWFIIYCVFTGSIDSYLCLFFFNKNYIWRSQRETERKGRRFNEKRRVPRIELWGTPQESGAEMDLRLPVLTQKHLSY